MDQKFISSIKRRSLSQGRIATIRSSSLTHFVVQKKPGYPVFDSNSFKKKINKESLQEFPVSSLNDEQSNLKSIIFNKHDRITELEYFNSFLEEALKKREDITKIYVEENLRLKEELKTKSKLIEHLKNELKAIKRSAPLLDQKHQSFYRKIKESVEKSSAYSNEIPSSHRHHSDLKGSVTDRLESEGAHKFDIDARSSMMPTEEDPMRVSIGPKETIKTMEEYELAFSRKKEISIRTEKRSESQRKPFKAVSQVVTSTQGRRGPHSLFLDNSYQASILQMTDSEMEQVLADPNLIKLEKLLKKENDGIIESLRLATEQEKNDIFETVRAIDNDIKVLASVVSTLKKLIRANSAISVSLVLYDALEKIVSETCEILDCDRASVFLLDQMNKVLWTKVAKGSNTTIKVPLDAGIVGCAATTGKSVRIDEAYLDDRFHKVIDTKMNYKTKTVLAMPIKDIAGNVIGVCQAINKLGGKLFTQDDEEVFQILTNQAGIMLKNSVKFDDTLVTHVKLSRLLRTSIDMYRSDTLSSFLKAAEISLRTVFSSEMAVIYLVEKGTRSLCHYDVDGNKMVFSMSVGLVGKAAMTGEALETKQPDNDPNYNAQVDIDTHLPLLSIPLFSQRNDERLLAVMQVADLQSSGAKLRLKGELWETENIEIFMDMARMCIERLDEKSQHSGIRLSSVVSEGESGQHGGGYYSILDKEERGKEGQVKTKEPTATGDVTNELNLAQFEEEALNNEENRRSKGVGGISGKINLIQNEEQGI